MIIVKITKMSYDQYGATLDALSINPHHLINQYYRPKLKTGFFCFEDRQYVPSALHQYIMKEYISNQQEKSKFSQNIARSLKFKSKKKSSKKN